MAAPIASQVLGEVLPYLELNKDNIPEDEKKEVYHYEKGLEDLKNELERLKNN